MNTVSDKIDSILRSTAPKSKERNAALIACKWVMSSPFGYAARVAGVDVLTDLKEQALVFDGRDGMSKVAFLSRVHGVKLEAELL